MKNDIPPDERARHLRITNPSPWVARFAPLVAKDVNVLDIAAGEGRHSRLFLNQGNFVTAVDKNTIALNNLSYNSCVSILLSSSSSSSSYSSVSSLDLT